MTCGGRCVGSLSLVGLLMAIAVSADAQCRQETSIGGMALQGIFHQEVHMSVTSAVNERPGARVIIT